MDLKRQQQAPPPPPPSKQPPPSATAAAVLSEYLNECSVHGLKFLLLRHWWQRIFWLSSVAVAGFFTVYFITQAREGVEHSGTAIYIPTTMYRT